MTKKSKRPPAPPSRVAVVVLGMHRSGTSALTGVLGQLGCDLPRDLMPPTEDNPKGYFESNKAYRLNDALLESAGSSWDDWQEFNPGWITSQRADAFRARARAMLDEEFGDSPLFVLKDPRICRFAPFWLDVLEQAECRPLIVCTHRNPLDVAASLERREAWPPAYGLLLWLRHVLDAEAGSRGRPRFFTSYERLIGNWAGVVKDMESALDMSFPRQSASVAAEVEAFLSRDLQHFGRDADAALANPLLSGWVRDGYEILETWAKKGERKADHARLDRIRAELNQAAPAFGGLIRDALSARSENADLRAARTGLKKDLEESQARLVETREARRNSDQTVEELRRARKTQQETLQQVQAQLAALKQARQSADQKAATAQAEAERLTQALEEARHERDTLRSSLEQRSHEAEQVGLELKARAEEVAKVTDALATARRKCERYEHDLERSERSLLLLKTQMARQMQDNLAESLSGGRTKPLEELRQRVEDITRERDAARQEREALEARLSGLDEELATARAAGEEAARQAAAQTDELGRLGESLAREKEAAAHMRAEYEQRIAELERGNRELLNSTSWRITEPLRRLVRTVRRDR